MNELYHYGVLGMKWGIRRDRNKNGKNVIKRGKEFNRVSTRVEVEPHPNREYVTFTKDDNDYYIKNMTDFRREFGGKDIKTYNITLQNVNDIVYSNHEKQVEEFF